MITILDEGSLPLALDFRHRMMTECGIAHLLADDWRALTGEFYARGWREGTCVHFGWREEGRIVATSGAMIRADFPAFTFKSRRYGWIVDVYVVPEYRRRGIARKLTLHTLDWLRERDIVVAKLFASEPAKQARLYERLGFSTTGEMMLRLDQPPAK